MDLLKDSMYFFNILTGLAGDASVRRPSNQLLCPYLNAKMIPRSILLSDLPEVTRLSQPFEDTSVISHIAAVTSETFGFTRTVTCGDCTVLTPKHTDFCGDQYPIYIPILTESCSPVDDGPISIDNIALVPPTRSELQQ